MFKDNKDFYPTPSSLAYKMVGMISKGYSGRILEPSAGKGDLVDAIKGKHSNRWGGGAVIDCIESD